MADPGPVPEPAGMDEATIDCTICGRDATLEVVDQVLDDGAEWRTIYRYVVCDEHRERVHFTLHRLQPHERVILNHCG